MPERRREQFQGGVATARSAGSNAPAQIAGLVSRLDGFSRRALNREIQARSVEAGEDGARLGAEGKFLRHDDRGVIGQNFNRRNSESYLNSQAIGIRGSIAGLALDHEADPEGFDKAVAALIEGTTEGAPDELAPYLEREIESRAVTARAQIGREAQRRVDESDQSILFTNLDGLITEIANDARGGPDSADALERTRMQIDAAVDGGIATGQISAEQGRVFKKGARTMEFEETVRGGNDRAVDKEAYIAKLRTGDVPGAKELTPTRRNQIADHMQARLDRDVRIGRSTRNANLRAFSKQVKHLGDMVEHSVDIPDEEFTRILTLSTLFPESIRDLEKLGGIIMSRSVIDRIKIMPVGEAMSEAEKFEREKTRTVAHGEAQNTVRRMANKHESELGGSDPMAYARATLAGVAGSVGPIDMSDPGPLAASVARAVEFKIRASNLYEQDLPTLTEAEVGRISDRLPRLGATAQAVMLEAIMAGAGNDDETMAIMEQLSRTGAGAYAQAGALMALGDEATATAILDGLAILKKPELAKIYKPPEADRLAVITEVLDGFDFADINAPDARAALISAGDAYYISKAAAGGVYRDEFSKGTYREALIRGAGGIFEWSPRRSFDLGGLSPIDLSLPRILSGGPVSKIVPPKPQMTPDQFDGLINGITNADIADMGGVEGVEDPAALLRSEAQLTTVGPGRYWIRVGGDAWINKKNNEPFELNLN